MPPDESQLILSDGTFPAAPDSEVTFTVENVSGRHFQPFRLEIAEPDGAKFATGVPAVSILAPAWTTAPRRGWFVLSLRIGIWEQIAMAAADRSGAPAPIPAQIFGPGAQGIDLPIVNPNQLVTLVMRNSSTEKRTIAARLVGRELSQ